MKKITLLLVLFVSGFVNAQIVNIPDTNFKNRLINIGVDTNTDGEIQDSEAIAFTSVLDLSNASIADLEGVQAFVNVTNLRCEGNLLTILNLENNPGLTFVDCRFNDLESLDVSMNVNLVDLLANDNILTTIDLPNHPNLETLWLFDNEITSLDLSNCPSLIELSCVENLLSTLDVSSNTALESLQCGQNQIVNLNVSNNPNLMLLDIGINPLNNGLDVSNCPALADLRVFGSNLETLDCSNNHNLTALYIATNTLLQTVFIKNGSDESSGNIDEGSWLENWLFGNNPSLTYVCADADQVIEIQGFAGTDYVVNSYCNFQPGGDFNTIEGTAQFDIDNDGCDAGDSIIPFLNFNVGLDSDPANSSVFSNGMGTYNLYVGETGTYSIQASFEDPTYFTVDPSPASVTIPIIDNSTTIQDFCITANGVRPDAEVVIAPIIPLRPGFDATHRLVYKNKGNQTLSGTVTFEYDDAVLDFVSSTTVPDMQSTGLLSFDFSDLQAFENRFVDIVLNVNDPTETPPVNIDDILIFTGNVSIDQAEETPEDNTFIYDGVVVGAFDPNDITCLQGDVAPSTLIGDFLHYIINFENTGNAPAENVVVTTQINPEDFDVNTLQILNTSDDMSLSITDNLVEFVFENIDLSSGGHGNILLKIRTNNDLSTSDSVNADADIYFDFNFPITTNTADTSFETLSVDEFSTNQSISLYPNPSDSIVTIEANETIKNIAAYDIQGQLIWSKDANARKTLVDISSFANGVYFMVIKTDQGEVAKKVLKK